MIYALVEAEKANYPVRVLCDVLGVSASGFYAARKRTPSVRAKRDEQLAVEIAAAHQKSQKRYGSPRVHRALRKKGIRVAKKRVARLMKEKQLIARKKRQFRKTTDSNHSSPIAPNVLERDFAAKLPNQAWAGDVTYIQTESGWAYLAVLLDLFSRRVVGWAISATNDTELALAALHRAVSCRRVLPVGLVHHTDRGSPYASEAYRGALASYAMTPSMSRKGDCWDNAVSESFFSTLRAELVDGERYFNIAEAKASIGDYIERFYNIDRMHSYLDYMSPIEFELRNQLNQIAA